MKRVIKIAYANFWKTFDPKKFTDATFNFLYDRFEFQISSDPDIVISSSVGVQPLDPKRVNVYWALEGPLFQNTIGGYDWAFSYMPDSFVNHPRYIRINATPPMFVGRTCDGEKVLKEKTKFCDFIYSHNVGNRNQFFTALSRYKRVDAPAGCMNNMQRITKEGDWIKNKLAFIKPYKFSIAFENANDDGYTTEKLVHPLQTNGIPIYWGNKHVAEDYNTKRFINCHEHKSLDDVIELVKELDNDDKKYIAMVSQPCAISSRESIVRERWLRVITEGKTR
jgi:hypothetical protein